MQNNTKIVGLYVRLNILKALQSMYMNNINEAVNFLSQAELDFRKLQLNDMDLATLQSMGFTDKEARRALRYTNSNMEQAIDHIYKKREQKQRGILYL